MTLDVQPLSPNELRVLEFIEAFVRARGYAPSLQEICGHFSFASLNSAQRYLRKLDAKGYVRLGESHQKRSLQLLCPSSAYRDSLDERPLSPPPPPPTAAPPPAERPSQGPLVPLMGRVAAGAPIEALEHDEFIEVPSSMLRAPERTFALRVQGDSMIEDGIIDGDVILVLRQSSADNGDIVVATIGEEATVKRFYRHRSKAAGAIAAPTVSAQTIELRPANASMSSLWFSPTDVDVRGVVVGLIRDFSKRRW